MDIFILGVTLAGIVIGTVITLVILRTKRKQSSPVKKRFDFDGYKAGELDKRGLIDRTKWH
ncbi:MAG: hypothetical protein ACP59X_05040 [Solidesulfovibrio sp. DCME]|uniref:hypothetical protein n=1 Tax=Desulfovibrionaceae TaxID=194924 RepID=UPI000573F85F|nr:hypothetical protein [Desulfovibrio sp. TomC]KHK01644.1 hypothetical protein NY78_2944 [Desulfovibrio sp. TomC]